MSQPHPSPAVTKAQARLYLPPAPCRRCVLRLRALCQLGSLAHHPERVGGLRCTRCDLTWPPASALRNARLRPFAEDPSPWWSPR